MGVEDCIQSRTLPVIVNTGCSEDKERVVEGVLEGLRRGYMEYYGSSPSPEETNAWKSFVKNVIDELMKTGYPLIFEYPLLGSSRIDLIVVGSAKALVVEGKGWRSLEVIDEVSAVADGKEVVNPCYQLNGYLSKLNHLHSAKDEVSFSGAVYAYNATSWEKLDCKVLGKGDLRKEVERLPLSDDVYHYVNKIVHGHLVLSKSLVEVLKDSLSGSGDIQDIAKHALEKLIGQGYSLTSHQAQLVIDVLSDLKHNNKAAYLVKGESGSGKTLVALTLFLLALSRGYKVLLGYVNNRLVNVLRSAVESALSSDVGRAIASLIGYSALPRRDGFCDHKHDYSKYGGAVDLLIIDEAQRLPLHSVKYCFTRPARVIVALYDEDQVLLANEAGTSANLLESAKASGRIVKQYELPGNARVPKEYINLVRELLWTPQNVTRVNTKVDVVVFNDIKSMLCELMKRYKEGNRIALVCAFTESEGDVQRKLCWDSLKNIRIGYPLQSGFSMYKSLNLKVKWLMDERREYPLYWQQRFDELAKLYAKYNEGFDFMSPTCVCSSVYGAQGMEAEYVGVVWGRDLIWRNGAWKVNPKPITDYVGGRYSLKVIANKDPSKALEMLRNRYYIMLTRATKGVYLFFEDETTKSFVTSALGAKVSEEDCELSCPCLKRCMCSTSNRRGRRKR